MKETVSHHTPESLSELEKEGLIQRFEYTFELSWKMLLKQRIDRVKKIFYRKEETRIQN
jgi:hypothetical protein